MTPRALFLSLALALPVDAQERDVEAGVVVERGVLEHALAVAGDSVYLEGSVPDLFAFARAVTVSGVVADNGFAFCESARLDGGRVEGDWFAFCRSARLDGEVGDDVYACAQEVLVPAGGIVRGDLTAAAERVVVEGAVEGRVLAGAGMVLIRGRVGGDVVADVGSLVVDEGAEVGGRIEYRSGRDAEVHAGATVAGGVERVPYASDPDEDEGGGLLGGLAFDLWLLLGGFLVGVAFLVVLRERAGAAARALGARPGRSVAVGLVAGAGLLAASLVGLVFLLPGLMGLMLLAVCVYLAPLVVALAVGRRLLRGRGDSLGADVAGLAAGLVAIQLATAIPYLGALLWLLAVAAGLGGMGLALRGAVAGTAAPAS